jgi:hypothetical protein
MTEQKGLKKERRKFLICKVAKDISPPHGAVQELALTL